MEMDRRRLLDLLGSGVLLSAVPSTLSAFTTPVTRQGKGSAALLLPITGAPALIGLSMQRATDLAQSFGDGKTPLRLFDTGETAETAAKAATTAVSEGAAVILGPLLAGQVKAVAAAAAGNAVPVVSFSNSMAALGSGAFVFGITPSQSVSAILQYARARGVRRLALVGGASPWSQQGLKAATRLAPEIGLQLVDVPGIGIVGADILQLLGKADGGLPDAALITGGVGQFAAQAQLLQQSGVQVLGTVQALDQTPAGLAALEGVWISAPDPAAVARFAQDYGAVDAAPPGAIAALAFDAAQIVSTLAGGGQLSREGLLRQAGFPGVAGAVQFRSDGRCVRELAILTVASGALMKVGRRAGL